LRVGAEQAFAYRASLRSNVPVERFEIVWNGEVAAALSTKPGEQAADVTGTLRVRTSPGPGARGVAASASAHDITVSGPGWLLLRAWSTAPDDDLLDVYPFATTSPIYVEVQGRSTCSAEAARYFLRWLDRLEAATRAHPDYRTERERDAVLADLARARRFYETCERQ
jgi:hypothetical protein